MPTIIEIANQPCEVKDLKAQARMNGETRERTVGFKCVFNYSSNILAMLSFDGQKYDLSGLWDEEGNPTPGIKKVEYDREFGHFRLVFKRNNKEAGSIVAENLHSWKTKPENGEMFEVEFRALAVVSEGDTEKLHKMVKDPGITLSIEAAPNGQESV